MLVGLGCHRKQHKVQWQLEKFSVLEILFNMATKKEIGRPNGFEGLLKYYVKLTPIRFIKQWVIPELYNELLLQIFSSWVTPLNGKKDRLDFHSVYCGGEWSNKLRLFYWKKLENKKK